MQPPLVAVAAVRQAVWQGATFGPKVNRFEVRVEFAAFTVRSVGVFARWPSLEVRS